MLPKPHGFNQDLTRKRRVLVFLVGLLLVTCPTVQPSTRMDASPSRPFTLALLGDVMLGRGVALAHPAGGAAWRSALAGLAPCLAPADLAVANLEGPLARLPAAAGEPGRYSLIAPPQAVDALTASGIDLLSLANNHRLDAGPSGVTTTLHSLHGARLASLGPTAPLTLTLRHADGAALRLAFLAFDDVSAPLDLLAVAHLVSTVHQDGTVVIVSIHWGGEYAPGPNPRQRSLAQALVQAGADLVWGHHPHVLQPVVWMQGRDRQRLSLVAFSLGNALFDQTPPEARRSAVLLVTLDAQGVRSLNAAPFEIEPGRGRIHPAAPQAANAVMERLALTPNPAIDFNTQRLDWSSTVWRICLAGLP